METKVFNLIILDESGSMECIKKQALSGLNETLQTIRKAQEKYPEQKQLVSIVPFESDNIRLLRDKEPISMVKDLKPEEYNPGTCTPLYDAIGYGISSIKYAVDDDDTVLVTIITDGYENDSKEYNGRSIAELIKHMKVQGWMFTYIGANQDAVEVAKSMNIHNALNFDQDVEGTKKMFAKENQCRSRLYDAIESACMISPTAKRQLTDIMEDRNVFFSDNYDEELKDIFEALKLK